ncbi:MAG: hypothetical protein A2287_04110 [Candidatus Melainabacteria bacterium RIFOXYA12_FULL_32_12]|nr:MAG: hypothetical protein A2255_02820 [Candidatus Melainabacteria bacterium RIFOXYA2_FULL_32_9]OGI29431.1 MAG: hypothetical protein A2287_04110 [Candidatus Melainabacteria bacterium RIFOXYA12_FULL_32_12]
MLTSNISRLQTMDNTNFQKNVFGNSPKASSGIEAPKQVSFGCAADGGIPEISLFLITSAVLRKVNPKKAEQLSNFVANHFNFKIKNFELPIGRKAAAFEKWENKHLSAIASKLDTSLRKYVTNRVF